MKKRWVTTFFFFWMIIFVPFEVKLEAAPSSTETKKHMLSQLDFIRSVFETKYAPSKWKQTHLGWNLDEQYRIAKLRIEKLKDPTLKDYRYILRDFFNSTQDYHVSVRFFSTESASLPFLVKSAAGRYFFSYLQRDYLPLSAMDLNVGDEVLLFNDKPTHIVIQELKKRELGDNTKETDQALAELLLTNRDGSSGNKVPSGPVTLTVKKKGSGEIKTYSFQWNYNSEEIKDFTKLKTPKTFEPSFKVYVPHSKQSFCSKTFWESGFFDKLMICPRWEKAAFDSDGNPHTIGSRKSFLPSLGNKIWESDNTSIFHAYIFTLPSGQNIGYVRIPHYLGDDIDLYEFAEIINLFQHETEALVIDEMNNPGGSVFYLYGLASMLTDKPLSTPKHHLALTQEDVNLAVTWLPILQTIHDDETAKEILGESFDGYPIDYLFAELMKEFCDFIVKEWNSGNLYTKPTFIFGVDEIQPSKEARYTKPILVLTNSLCFSGGDFFPAILQDNKRATLMGTRTAGAGGYILRTRFPNHMGVRDFHLTGSLAERIDQKPLENLGVTPDIKYTCTVKDLQENYPEFVQNVLQTLKGILK